MNEVSDIIEILKKRVKYDKIYNTYVPYFWGYKIVIVYRDFLFTYMLHEEVKRTQSNEDIALHILEEYLHSIVGYYFNE